MSQTILPFIFSLAMLITSLVLFKNRKLGNRQAYFWIVISLLGILVSLFLRTNLITNISKTIGIQYPPSLLISLGIMILLSISLAQSLMLSKQEEEIKKLTQRTAILEESIDSIKKTDLH